MKDICLNIASFKDGNRTPVIKRGISSGVKGFVFTGTSLTATRISLEYHEKWPEISCATAGVHPHHCLTWDASSDKIMKYAQHDGVRAIGECGLDYDRFIGGRDAQIHAFKEQLKIAQQLNKPAFLHIRPEIGKEREVMKDFLNVYKEFYGKVDGVVHCFTGNAYMLEALLDMDFSIGITGWVCDDRRGSELQRLICDIPDDKLMIETDAPYLTPKNMPKELYKRENEPAFLGYVLKKVAQLKGISAQDLNEITDENCLQFFHI